MERQMKQRRCWTVWLMVLLMAASLVIAPREGSAGPAGGRTILPGDPPQPEISDPEVPIHPAPMMVDEWPHLFITFFSTAQLDLFVTVILVDSALSLDNQPRPVRRDVQ